ncbi:MAG: EamA family transporter RarD [Cellulomonas sp.]|nr:EamA family transporter RarD [Cellulomonas sp.]
MTGVPRSPERSGIALGLTAYGLWGLLPLYFPLMAPAGAVEVIGHRIVWSLVLCLVILVATRSWRAFTTVLADRRAMAVLALASVLLATNWLTFVIGVTSGHTVDAALGYFINPLVVVGLAVGVLHERLRRTQWVALGLGAAAVVVISVGNGAVPWIGLTVAVTFAGYGLLKNRMGRTVAATPGLAAETLVLTPVALGYLGWLQVTGAGAFTGHGSWHLAALISLGVVTTIPLLAFNAAARRLPLSVVGLLQYVTPLMHLAIGVLVQHEAMPAARWWGFALVWVAVALLVIDGLRASHQARQARTPVAA